MEKKCEGWDQIAEEKQRERGGRENASRMWPVHTSMENTTYTLESSTLAPSPATDDDGGSDDVVNPLDAVRTPTSTTNDEPDSDFPSEVETVSCYHYDDDDDLRPRQKLTTWDFRHRRQCKS